MYGGALWGADVRVRGVEGPGLTLVDAEADLARLTVEGNEVGVLRQGETAERLAPAHIAGNARDDEICVACSPAPPEVLPPRPLPPL